MKVKFGEGPAVLAVEGVGRVERGKSVEVDKELGEQLLAQGWKRVGTSSKKTTSSKSKKTTAATPAETTAGAAPQKDGDE